MLSSTRLSPWLNHIQRTALPLSPRTPPVMVKTRRAHRLASEIERNDEPAPKRIKLPDAEASVPSRSRKSQKIQPNIDINSFPKRHISPWKVGAHVSVAGGVENAILNAAEIGANAFALFLKSQRKWTSPPLTKESIDAFKERMATFGYSSSVVLPHGSYLINLGNPDPAKRKQSFECFLDDLQRCEQLGLTLYNFHPGSTVGATTIEESIRLVAECINKAHSQTTSVITVIENMAGAGNVIGHDFAHLGGIISQVEDKSRVGVCIDTCHMFSAGYDIRKKEDWDAARKSRSPSPLPAQGLAHEHRKRSVSKFEAEVGISYLRGMHLNDSKTELSSRKDRHENIGLGNIGIMGFHHILNDPRIQNIPLVLETPSFETPKETWAKEIEALNRLSGLELEKLQEDGSEIVDPIKNAVGLLVKAKPKPRRGIPKASQEEVM